jgi:geranylgeranyl pyrophosphate synthase
LSAPKLDLEQFLMTTGTAEFAKRLDQTAEDTEALLEQLLADAAVADEIARPKRLIEAMRYSSLGGGKRLRPFLVVESAAVFGVPRPAALLAGAALECIHCYSLIHDDLPAMDNSDLRRGRPTLHKAYDDATAILAGDALLTIAFDIITRDEIHKDANVRLLLTRALARASGVGGMAGGQMLDLAGEGRYDDREPVDVARLQQMKTGALLRFGCIAGAILGQSSRPSRSPTICSTSRETRRHSANRPARMRRWARPRSSPSLASRARGNACATCWRGRIRRYRSSARGARCCGRQPASSRSEKTSA